MQRLWVVYKMTEDRKYVYIILILIFIIAGVSILGFIENNDMQELNDAFFKVNMSEPIEVLEYLNLCTTKPIWRVSLMASVLLASVTTAIYTFSQNMHFWLFFAIILGISYIFMSSYLSYYSFHILTPNGGQDNYHKLRYYDCKHVTSKFSYTRK